MKTQFLSMRNASVSIGFLLLVSTTLLGCLVNKGENMLVRKLDAVLLTADDLPTMEVDTAVNHRKLGVVEEPPVIDGFIQSWNGTQPEEHITVHYWLFQSVADAQKAADEWRSFIAAEPAYHPEPNAEDVVGDATWRADASIWFVKNSVLVYVMERRPLVNQLPLTRSVARKVEAKIEAVLKKK